MTIENADISGAEYVGALIGASSDGNSTVENVTVMGNITMTGGRYVGGLVGHGHFALTDCKIIGNDGSSITGISDHSPFNGFMGGLIGYTVEGCQQISNCAVENIAISGGWYIGGITGIAQNNTKYSECEVNNVSISSDNPLIGVIAGANQAGTSGSVQILDCTASGTTATGADQVTTQKIAMYNVSGSPVTANTIVGSSVTFDNSGKVTGGLFEQITADMIAAGFESKETADGTFELVPTDNAAVAKVNHTYYTSLTAAIEAAQSGGTIEVLADVDLDECLLFNKSVTIQGNGHTLTNTANRIVRLTQPNLSVNIYQYHLVSHCNNPSDVRGISFDNISSGSSLLLDGCSVSTPFYAIHVVTGAKNLSVTIKNGSVAAGWAAINSCSNNSTFIIENSQLTGINSQSESKWHNFGTIVFDGNGINNGAPIGTYGSKNTVYLRNSTVKASTESSNQQDWLSLQYGAVGNKVYADSASRMIDDDNHDMSETVFVHFQFQNIGPYNPQHFVSVQKSDESYRIWAPAGNTITLPAAASKSGYTFVGWSDGNAVYPAAGDFVMPEANTVTLTACWNKISTGGSSSTGNKTETTTNPDGSTTTTVTRPDGSTTETTKNPDGSSEVVDTKKDGTVTTTTTDKVGNKTETVEKTDGSSQTTVTNKDGSSSTTVSTEGQTETQVKLPDAVVHDAVGKGEAVALPMPQVSATTDRETAPAVTVTLPGSSTAAKVEIPVENITAGTVAILVKADGTEEVIKTSITTETGVAVTLSDGDTVKIVDNSRDFTDVSDNYWAAEAVDFTTSRELFTGTSATTFSPNTAMTRAMIVTVLARFEGVDTTTGDTWYEAGAAWAVERGISDGTSLDQNLTREQLATMLWRYAGSPAASADMSGFADAASVSDYAQQAMTWAAAPSAPRVWPHAPRWPPCSCGSSKPAHKRRGGRTFDKFPATP